MRFAWKDLEMLAVAIFARLGSPADEAALVARLLTTVPNHAVCLLLAALRRHDLLLEGPHARQVVIRFGLGFAFRFAGHTR